jgi:hypothetical protein
MSSFTLYAFSLLNTGLHFKSFITLQAAKVLMKYILQHREQMIYALMMSSSCINAGIAYITSQGTNFECSDLQDQYCKDAMQVEHAN